MKPRLPYVGIAALMFLAGCASDLGELQTWADGERKAAKPSVKAIEAPKRFVPQAYEAISAVDPFSAQKLSVAGKQEAVSTQLFVDGGTRAPTRATWRPTRWTA